MTFFDTVLLVTLMMTFIQDVLTQYGAGGKGDGGGR